MSVRGVRSQAVDMRAGVVAGGCGCVCGCLYLHEQRRHDTPRPDEKELARRDTCQPHAALSLRLLGAVLLLRLRLRLLLLLRLAFIAIATLARLTRVSLTNRRHSHLTHATGAGTLGRAGCARGTRSDGRPQ